MDVMICMRGESEQIPFLSEIAELGAGIELGGYGMIGVQSEADWGACSARHKAVPRAIPWRYCHAWPFHRDGVCPHRPSDSRCRESAIGHDL